MAIGWAAGGTPDLPTFGDPGNILTSDGKSQADELIAPKRGKGADRTEIDQAKRSVGEQDDVAWMRVSVELAMKDDGSQDRLRVGARNGLEVNAGRARRIGPRRRVGQVHQHSQVAAGDGDDRLVVAGELLGFAASRARTSSACAVRKSAIAARSAPHLLITVDNGISSMAGVLQAQAAQATDPEATDALRAAAGRVRRGGAMLYYGLPGVNQLHSPFRWVFALTLMDIALAKNVIRNA